MKYKIVLGLILLSAVPALQTINKRTLRAVQTANKGNLTPLCDLLRKLNKAETRELEDSKNSSVSEFRTRYGGKTPAQVCATKGGGAAAARTPLQIIGRFISENVLLHPDWSLTRMLRENGQTQAEFERRGEWSNLQVLYELKRINKGLPSKPARPSVTSRRGGGRVSPVAGPATPPKPLIARELDRLREEIKGAIEADTNHNNYAEIVKRVLDESELLTGRKPLTTEQRDELLRFGWIVSFKLYITDELTHNHSLTTEELLKDGEALTREERSELEEFVKTKRTHLLSATPPAYAPPPSTRPPLSPPALNRLKEIVKVNVHLKPEATLDGILADQDQSRATLAPTDYAQLEETYQQAKEEADLPPFPGPGAVSPIPPPPPLSAFRPDGGGVRGGMLDGIRGHGGVGALRPVDGAAAAAGPLPTLDERLTKAKADLNKGQKGRLPDLEERIKTAYVDASSAGITPNRQQILKDVGIDYLSNQFKTVLQLVYDIIEEEEATDNGWK